MKIKGNYDAREVSNLMIVFEKCDPRARAKKGLKCKTDAEIEQWMQFKYFIVLENGRQFVQYKFGEERIDQSAKVSWYPISSRTRVDMVRMITRNDMSLDDDPMNLGGIFVDSTTGYELERSPTRELPYTKGFWNSIMYEVSLHQVK